jgi:hypothetical protein
VVSVTLAANNTGSLINEALGLAAPMNDLTGDAAVTIVDVQIVSNAAAGRGCTLM